MPSESATINSEIISASLGGSLLDNIVNSAKKEAESKSAKRKDKLQIQEVENVWVSYQNNAQSPSVVGVLQHKKFQLTDDTLSIIVPSDVAKNMISAEYELLTSLRQLVPNDDFNIQLVVSKDEFGYLIENESKMLISFEDKLDHLKSKNPMILNLIKQLKLKKDNY